MARVGVEGTGTYGAGLARFSAPLGGGGARGRPPEPPSPSPARQVRHRGRRRGRPCRPGRPPAGQAKTRDGNVEAIRALVVAKRSAKSTRIKSLNQIRHLGFTAPEEIRQPCKDFRLSMVAKKAAAMRPRAGGDPVVFATKTALALWPTGAGPRRRDRAHRQAPRPAGRTPPPPSCWPFPASASTPPPPCLSPPATTPHRLRSEPAWAHLCGVAPIEASSGKVTRWRLNRGGDRQANAALWRIVITRMSNDPRTHAYVARRSEEGLSKGEIIRVLKRYVAREVYQHLPRT